MSSIRSQFTWSYSSFLTGISVTLDLSTILSAYVLWSKLCASRHASGSSGGSGGGGGGGKHYFAVLGLIALAHACDMCLRTAVTALTITDKVSKDTGDFVYRDLTAGTLSMNLISLMLAWTGGVGFVGLNVVRFRAVASIRMPIVTRVVSGLAGVSIAVCSVNNILFAYGFIGLYRYGEASSYPRFMESLNRLFSGWSIYDSIINAIISLAFVTYLQRMLLFLAPSTTLSDTISSLSHLAPNDTALAATTTTTTVSPPRSKPTQLMHRISWILGFECSAMIASNIFVQVFPTLDPLWNSIYLSESIRLRLFCTFFVLLNRMVGESRQAHKAGGVQGLGDEETALSGRFGADNNGRGDVGKHGGLPSVGAARVTTVTIPLMTLGTSLPVGVPQGLDFGSEAPVKDHDRDVKVQAGEVPHPVDSGMGPHFGDGGRTGGSVLDQTARHVYGM